MAQCPSCGTAVAEGMRFCEACGSALAPGGAAVSAPGGTSPARPEPWQARPAGTPPTYGPTYPPPVMYPVAPPYSALPTVGGVLLLIAGVLGLVSGFSVIALGGTVGSVVPGASYVQGILTICGGLVISFSVIAIIGGVFALRRRLWGIALVGSILGLFAIGPLFLSSVFSLVALILIAISHKEFR